MDTFKEKIEPLVKYIDKLCMENGIQYWSEFYIGNDEKAFYHTPDMLIDMTTLYSHIQKWQVKNNKSNNITLNINVDEKCSAKSLLTLIKMELEKLK